MTAHASAYLDAKYRLVVPKEVREALHLRPNDNVLFLIEDNSVYLRPRPQSFTDKLSGLHREVWNHSTDWLEKERSTWDE